MVSRAPSPRRGRARPRAPAAAPTHGGDLRTVLARAKRSPSPRAGERRANKASRLPFVKLQPQLQYSRTAGPEARFTFGPLASHSKSRSPPASGLRATTAAPAAVVAQGSSPIPRRLSF
mmetsp:Transcript_47642/g.111195  ORF Transcript_47642/g.111195 Transcript_47642/m.111195 type:complete len:119 (-) Transcript_47642:83-439(-)